MGDKAMKTARHVDNTKKARGKAQVHGAWGCHIIRRFDRDGRTWELHATKGWRNYRSVK